MATSLAELGVGSWRDGRALVPDLLSDLSLRSALCALLRESLPVKAMPHLLPAHSSKGSTRPEGPLDGVDWLQQVSRGACMHLGASAAAKPATP